MHKTPHLETSKAARRTAMPSGNGKNKPVAKPPPVTAKPEKFTYALSAFSAEIRDQGWYVARTVPGFTGEKPKWSGPFETIESERRLPAVWALNLARGGEDRAAHHDTSSDVSLIFTELDATTMLPP